MFRIIKWPLINLLIFSAIIFSGLYIYNVFFDFVLSLFYHSKLNISSLAYIALRAAILLAPLLLFTAASRFGTAKCLQIIFTIVGVCYLLGNTWVIYFLVETKSISALLNLEQLILVQYSEALVLNYLIWNCFTLWNVLFSTVQGVLYLMMAHKIMYSRRQTLRIGGIIVILSILLPLVSWFFNPEMQNFIQAYGQLDAYSFISRYTYLSWIRENIFFLLSQITVYGAMLIAGTSHDDWVAFAYER